MRNVLFTATLVALSGCASLNPTVSQGHFNFDGNLSVGYEVNQHYYLDREERDCIIGLTLKNNSALDQKPLLTIYFVKNSNTFAERSVYFPKAFAGGTSQATITLRNVEMRHGICKELTSNMKASLKDISN